MGTHGQQKHTIIIPTFNRPELLRNLVDYYTAQASPFTLLVLDSSRAEIVEENANALSTRQNVLHKVYPPDVKVMDKLCAGLALVRTPFLSFCGDDDLVFPGGIDASLSFLSQHPDYVCTHGLYFNFRVEDSCVYLASEYSGPSIDAAHPGARIFALCQKYESLFYAVFRTHDAQAIFNNASKIASLHFQELFQSIAAALQGKIKRLPVLYGARRSGPPAEADRVKWQTYGWFADDPAELITHYAIYRKALWAHVQADMTNQKFSEVDFSRTLDLAHAVYFAAGCSPDYFYAQLNHLWPDDKFRASGRLDAIHEASRMLIMKRALLPDGRQLDIWDQLRGAGSGGLAGTGVFGGIRFLYQSLLGYLNIKRINRSAPSLQAWQLQLPKTLLWLGGDRQFQIAYRQLCVYLSKTDRK